eukprot:COSAG05_NODE_12767_length_455_cov_1.044944_1_plen_82_part_10
MNAQVITVPASAAETANQPSESKTMKVFTSPIDLHRNHGEQWIGRAADGTAADGTAADGTAAAAVSPRSPRQATWDAHDPSS